MRNLCGSFTTDAQADHLCRRQRCGKRPLATRLSPQNPHAEGVPEISPMQSVGSGYEIPPRTTSACRSGWHHPARLQRANDFVHSCPDASHRANFRGRFAASLLAFYPMLYIGLIFWPLRGGGVGRDRPLRWLRGDKQIANPIAQLSDLADRHFCRGRQFVTKYLFHYNITISNRKVK